MAVHQYIGARYVPYYYENSLDPTSTEWEPNVTYEPLTVVTLPNQHSYISKKTVPASVGSPALNADYWLDSGSYDAYIQNLQDQIDAITPDVAANTQAIDDIIHEKKRLVVITDSYGLHLANPWNNRVASNLQASAPDDYFAFAEGGSGFDVAGLSGHTFETLLQDNITSVTDKNTITDVIFGGGCNDFFYLTSANSLNSAIISATSYAKTQFPNAKIWVSFMGYVSYMSAAKRLDYKTAIACYQEASLANKCAFIDAYQPMHSYLNRADHSHPNNTGAKYIAEIVTNAILGGNDNLITTSFSNVALTAPTGFTTSGDYQLGQRIEKDNAIVKFFRFALTGSIASVAGGVGIEIGTYDLQYMSLISENDQVINLGVAFLANSVWECLPCTVYTTIDPNDPMKAKVMVKAPKNLSSVTNILVPEQMVTIPLVDC